MENLYIYGSDASTDSYDPPQKYYPPPEKYHKRPPPHNDDSSLELP